MQTTLFMEKTPRAFLAFLSVSDLYAAGVQMFCIKDNMESIQFNWLNYDPISISFMAER